MKRKTFAGLTFGGLAAPLWVSAGTQAFREELQWAGVPGASFARTAGEAVTAQAWGLRDVARRRPVTESTIFEAASLSKAVFAYGVVQLMRHGHFDLDRPLDDYLPAPYPIADPRGRRVTGRQVLTHSSGLPNWREHAGEPLTLAFDPGSRYRYSGEGFYFLQTVIEHVTGTSLTRFMRPVLDGLGMKQSDYIWRARYEDNCALPYDKDGKLLPHDTENLGVQLLAKAQASRKPLDGWTTAESLRALPDLKPPQAALPWNAMPNVAWSLLTTAREYAAFVRALLNDRANPMLEPAVPVDRYIWRGLGVALQKTASSIAFYHTGANPGFKAVMFGDLRRNEGVVSFTNGEGGFPFNVHVVEQYLGAQPAVFYLEQP